MQQRVSLITLGVVDVGIARSFYERLGWRVGLDAEETVFFQVGGLVIAGVFIDPDGHPWEVAHNPGFELRDDGSVILPQSKA